MFIWNDEVIKKQKENWKLLPVSTKEKRVSDEKKAFRKRRLSLKGIVHGKSTASQIRDDVTNRKASDDIEANSRGSSPVLLKSNRVLPTQD